MSLHKRQVIVFLLIAVFIIIGPTILLLASGYRYSWEKQRIEKTGIIDLTSVPKGAEVAVNGKNLRQVTPTAVSNLLPEDYTVEVKLSGYFPWKKTLPVKSGETTFARSIVLIRDILPQLIKPTEIIASAVDVKQTLLIYLTADKPKNNLSIFDFETGHETSLAQFVAGRYGNIQLSISPDGTRILFDAIDTKTKLRSLTLYNVTNLTSKTILETKATQNAKKINYHWSTSGSELLLLNNNQLSIIDAQFNIQPVTIDHPIQDALLGDKFIWLISQPAEIPLLSRLPQTITTTTKEEIITDLPTSNYYFVTGDDHQLWLSGNEADSGLVVNSDQITIKHLPKINGLRLDNAASKTLLWNDFEIYTMEADGSGIPELITRLGEPIKNVSWHPQGGYLILSTTTGMTAIESDGRDHRNVFPIVKFDSITTSAISSTKGSLFFVGSVGNQSGIYERSL